MSAVTEGYVDARTDTVRAEAAEKVAQALLSLERSNMLMVRWVVGTVIAVFAAHTAITIALLF